MLLALAVIEVFVVSHASPGFLMTSGSFGGCPGALRLKEYKTPVGVSYHCFEAETESSGKPPLPAPVIILS